MSSPLRRKKSQPKRHPNIKELLLAEEPRFEDIVPARGGWKSRPPIDFGAPEFSSDKGQNPHPSRKRRG